MTKLFALAALFPLAAPAMAQSTWYVDAAGTPPGDGSQGNPYTSIQYGIDQPATLSGDTLLILPGTYSEDLDLSGKSLELIGTAGAAATTIQGSGTSSVVLVLNVAQARFEGLGITGGSGRLTPAGLAGGGVLVDSSTVELSGCVLADNEAVLGGGLYASASAVVVDGCTVTHNRAEFGAGLRVGGGSLEVLSSTIAENWMDSYDPRGGGIWIGEQGSLHVADSELRQNTSGSTAAPRGGGIWIGGGSPALLERTGFHWNSTEPQLGGGQGAGGAIYATTMVVVDECEFANNSAGSYGGGGAIHGPVTATNSSFTGNSSYIAGAIRAGMGTMLTDCVLTDNNTWVGTGECGGRAGAIMGGTLLRCVLSSNNSGKHGGAAIGATLIECEVTGNQCGWDGEGCWDEPRLGGALYQCTATDCTIIGNTVTAHPMIQARGGGAADCTLIGCLVEGNIATCGGSSTSLNAAGGGAAGSDLDGCVVRNNRCEGSATAHGGGVFGGTATDCLIEGNRAYPIGTTHLACGGGAASATLTRCVLLDNEADHGGGAWNCSMEQCTVAANTATVAGGALSGHPGLANGTGMASALDSSIVWGNLPDELVPDVGSIAAEYTDVAGGWPGIGNLSADPLFWNPGLGDLALRPGSPCIDAGNPALPQDGDGSPADMGALPYDASYCPIVTYCVAKTNSQGCTPSVASSGTPTATGPDDFVVTASDVINQQPGLLFWGSASAEVPFYGGTRCVAAPIVRTPTQTAGGNPAPPQDCSGTYAFAFTQAYMASKGLAPGDRVYAQYWCRDPAHPDGTGVGLTDAIDFTICP